MNRRFWLGLMMVALILAVGSAYVILDKLAHPAPQPKPVVLKTVPAPRPAPSVAVSTAAAAVETSTAAAKPAEPVEPAPAARKPSNAKRNILFKLIRSNAKQISIIGDFNNWTRRPMKRRGKTWQLSVPLAPGTYEYAFIVDGKRIRDPNNRRSAPKGTASVLIVKPLADRR